MTTASMRDEPESPIFAWYLEKFSRKWAHVWSRAATDEPCIESAT